MEKKIPASLLKILTTRIFYLGMTSLAIVMIFLSFLAYRYLVEQHQVQINIHINSIKSEFKRLQNHALAEASLLSNRKDIITTLATKNKNKVQIINKLLKRHLHTTDISHILVTDINGSLVTAVPYFKATYQPLNNFLKSSIALERSRNGLSGKSIEIDESELAIIASMPVFLPQADYRIAGTVTTEFHIDQKFITNIKRRIGLDVAILIDGSLFTSTMAEKENILSVNETSKLAEIITSHKSRFTESSFTWLSVADTKYLTAISDLTGDDNINSNIHLVLLENRNVLWKQISALITAIFLSFILTLGSISILTYIITRKITIPIKTVSDALTVLSRGAYPQIKKSYTSLETMHLTEATENLSFRLKKDKEEIAQAELELIESETNLSALAENASDGILVVDGEQYLYINEQAKTLLGYNSVSELFNKTLSDIVHPDEFKKFLSSYFNRTDETNLQPEYETLFIKNNGESIPVELSVTNTTWKGDKAGLIFFRDISVRKKTDAELREHREHLEELVEQRTFEFRQQAIELEAAMMAAEKANKAKSTFLSQMSHELRTPLNAIMGFSQLIDTEDSHPLNENQQDMVKEIMLAGKHLLELINEVLDLSRIESGRVSLTPTRLNISEIVETCVSQLQNSLAANRSIQINNLIKQDEFFIFADALRFRQILINFISNAVKYNKDEGKISIDCILKPKNRIRVEVIDTGIGIPKDELSSVFEAFERVNPGGHSIEGTGIGLSVCKQLAEAMAGTMGVESELGKGSTFWFELPINQESVSDAEIN